MAVTRRFPMALPAKALPVKNILSAILLPVTLLLNACEQQQAPPPAQAVAQPAAAEQALLGPATLAAWQLGETFLDTSLDSSTRLCAAVQQFLQQADQPGLENARRAWQQAHNDYHRFDVFLALAGSSPGLFGDIAALNSPLDSWPITPGYLDYFAVYTHSGIVNDIAVPVTAEAIRRQHGFSDDADVSLGFHAMAYLLWGEQGRRPPSDFAVDAEIPAALGDAGLSKVDLPANRRRSLLALMCNLLGDDLQNLRRQWSSGDAVMQQQFLQLLPHSRLQLLQQAAGYFLVAELAEKQLEPLLQPGTEPSESLHSFYAGASATAMAAGLDGLQQLLDTETGLGSWILQEQSERQQLQQQLSQARELLQRPADILHTRTDAGESDPAVTELHALLLSAAALLAPDTD